MDILRLHPSKINLLSVFAQLSLYISLFILSGCQPNYKVKDGGVYRIVSAVGHYNEILIKGADPATFEELNEGFAKDCCYVYWEGRALNLVDPLTTEVLSSKHLRDINRVFYKDKTIFGADPKTFKVDPSLERLSEDKNDFYFGNSPIGVKDKSQFKVVQTGHTALWASDGEFYYYIPNFSQIQKVKSKGNSSKILSEHYLIDDTSVYFGGNKLKGANPDEFVVIGNFHAKDNNNAYYKSDKIIGADVHSFKSELGMMSSDRRCTYRGSELLSCSR